MPISAISMLNTIIDRNEQGLKRKRDEPNGEIVTGKRKRKTTKRFGEDHKALAAKKKGRSSRRPKKRAVSSDASDDEEDVDEEDEEEEPDEDQQDDEEAGVEDTDEPYGYVKLNPDAPSSIYALGLDEYTPHKGEVSTRHLLYICSNCVADTNEEDAIQCRACLSGRKWGGAVGDCSEGARGP